ncbi:hypothetical protein R1sor_023970 [Riccia sorocarpa]|uniref:Uncharacterized protein n=1 Tax=Riccia sorocarpa TaxID=122646 RepID=A0ABD3GRH6_9MARC
MKHLQDDMEKRLSSVGAIAPVDSHGRKKMKNRDGALAIASSSDLRGRTIRRRVQTEYKHVDVFTLQELKSKKFDLKKNLAILAGGRTIVDYSENSWGSAMLIIKPTLRVRSTEVQGSGQVAWAIVETNRGPVWVMTVSTSLGCKTHGSLEMDTE